MVRKIFSVTYDILKGANATVWGGVEEAGKVGKIVKTGLSGADVVVGTSHTLEYLTCGDNVCATLNLICCISSSVGLIVGNIPATKHMTVVTGSITVGFRAVRYYCKNYGTFWGCTVATAEGLKYGAKFIIQNQP